MQRHIEATASVRAELEAVAAVLCDPVEVMGVRGDKPGSYIRQMVAELRDGTSVRQDVVVRMGVPERSDGTFRCGLAWHPTGQGRLLPAFDGLLAAEAEETGGTRFRISGVYRPPLGPVGAIADAAGLKKVARATLRIVTHEVAAAVDSVVDSRRGNGWVAGPLPDDLRPTPSEHWLG